MKSINHHVANLKKLFVFVLLRLKRRILFSFIVKMQWNWTLKERLKGCWFFIFWHATSNTFLKTPLDVMYLWNNKSVTEVVKLHESFGLYIKWFAKPWYRCRHVSACVQPTYQLLSGRRSSLRDSVSGHVSLQFFQWLEAEPGLKGTHPAGQTDSAFAVLLGCLGQSRVFGPEVADQAGMATFIMSTSFNQGVL